MKTLVLALDGLGDQVLRQPLLSGLVDEGHDVTVAVRRGVERVLPLVDPRLAVHACPFDYNHPPGLQQARECLDALASLRPDLVVSAQFDPVRYSDWILRRLPGARSAGFAGGREQEVVGARGLEDDLELAPPRRLDLSVACDVSLPEAEKNRRLLVALTGRTTGGRPRVSLPPASLDAARRELARLGLQSGAYVVCCPAGTANVRIKAWPAWRFASLVSWVRREHALPVLVIGHVSEAAIVEGVTRLVEGPCPPAFLGRDEDLALVASLLALSSLYVGNDTGPMHLAAASGVPVVALFGGGHWPRFLPVAGIGAAHTQELACFGCGWLHCVFGDAPCVGLVEEADVRQSVGRALRGERGFELRTQAPIPEEQVRARPLQRLRQVAAEVAAELDRLPGPGSTAAAEALVRIRAGLRRADESAREIAERADRLEREREGLDARAADQDRRIRQQTMQIGRLEALARRAPLVTVVTPALNAARWIEGCILSVLGQDYTKLEHIVVVRGSDDGTLGICARYPHLVVCSGPDLGASDALNRGFALGRGDILAWLDADAEYLARAVSIAVDTLLAGHEAVAGLCRVVGRDGRGTAPHPANPATHVERGALLRFWRAQLPRQAVFWTRRLWERAGPVRGDLDFAMDYDLWLRMSRTARFHRVGVDLAACHERDDEEGARQEREALAEIEAVGRAEWPPPWNPQRWVLGVERWLSRSRAGRS